MHGVATRDVRRLLDVVCAIEYDPRERCFAPDGLMALCDLLEADWVTYCERPSQAPRFTIDIEVGTRPFIGHNDELESIFYTHHPDFPLDHAPVPAGGIILLADVATERAWRRSAFYNEWCREVHVAPQANVILSAPVSSVRRSLAIDLADDAGRSFGDRERALLELVRPAFLRPIEKAEAARARQRALGITPRELEVLKLVRDGLTNGEIAAQLFVSPGTVRSHLEHAFAKIGAHTRTEAVARLGELG